ncbi:MAG TPA: ABC transporter substrate-binding protein [Stellaceae bacterium]|nr:ABC transporter substrate-binding protein [Stellaceae bacterium]
MLLAAPRAALAQAATEKPIVIGVPTPTQTQAGRDTQDALAMLVEDLNAHGGILGRKLRLAVEDETETPARGVAAIDRLIDKKVDVLIGGNSSAVTLAQLPHIIAAKTIYLGIGVVAPTTPQAKGKPGPASPKYIFRTNPMSSDHLAESITELLTTLGKPDLAIRKVAFLGENAPGAQELVPILKKSLATKGIQVPVVDLFDPETSDFSPLLTKARDAGIDFMVTLLSHSSSEILAKQWYDTRFPAPYGGFDVVADDADFFTRVDGKAIGEIVGTPVPDAPITPATQPFYAAFRGRYEGRRPSYAAFGAYDALLAYKAAVERAQTTAADAVATALEKTDLQGVRGRLVFDDRHEARYGPGYLQTYWRQWQGGGKRVFLYPRESATGTFQMPPWLSKKTSTN